MNYAKSKRKKAECKRHRQFVYEYALDKLMAREVPPEYLRERFLKLKEVR